MRRSSLQASQIARRPLTDRWVFSNAARLRLEASEHCNAIAVVSSPPQLPRVLRLEYEMVVEDDHPDRYEDSKPVKQTVGDFDCELVAYRLTATPHVRFPDIYDACDAFEPDLCGWECHYEIISGVRVRFRFAGGAIEEADEDTGQPVVVPVFTSGTEWQSSAQPIGGTLRESHYPIPPPARFHQSERLGELRNRYRDVVLGRDRLLGFGYFMITAIEADYGGDAVKPRNQAARELNVDLKVLGAVAQFASERSHDVHGRKAGYPPLTYGEEMFFRMAIRRLLIQIGHVEAGSTPPRLGMRNLPSPEARAPWGG